MDMVDLQRVRILVVAEEERIATRDLQTVGAAYGNLLLGKRWNQADD